MIAHACGGDVLHHVEYKLRATSSQVAVNRMSMQLLDCDCHNAITSTQFRAVSTRLRLLHNGRGDEHTCAVVDAAGTRSTSTEYIV